MARRKQRAATARTGPKRRASTPARRVGRTKGGFVGRDPSPVLDRYPPKPGAPAAPQRIPVAPSRPSAPAPATLPMAAPTPDATGPAPKGLITLDRPFDVDEFSQMLGETTIRVTVPKEDLGEVLRRITDFMGFGIYVYAFQVRPAAEESLRRFQVELRRVDFAPAQGDWVTFEDSGPSDSPFGPGATR